MVRQILAMLLAACTASAQAQPADLAAAVQPSVDSVEQRKSLRSLISCVAKVRPNWARQLLAQPYLSDAQARAAGEVFGGKDTCLPRGEMEMTFRTSSIVSNLAEHFLRGDLPNANVERMSQTLNSLAPLNASEDFALCVAARSPSQARDLVLSDLGSNDERKAAGEIGKHVPACVAQGENLTVDLQALRALMSIALYRVSSAANLAKY